MAQRVCSPTPFLFAFDSFRASKYLFAFKFFFLGSASLLLEEPKREAKEKLSQPENATDAETPTARWLSGRTKQSLSSVFCFGNGKMAMGQNPRYPFGDGCLASVVFFKGFLCVRAAMRCF